MPIKAWHDLMLINRLKTLASVSETRVKYCLIILGLNAMKVRASVKKICDECRVVKRARVVKIVCKKSSKHNQRQG